MGFYNNTSWPIYISIIAVTCIILIFFIFRNFSKEPKEFIWGLVILTLSSIAAGTYKLIEEFNVISQYSDSNFVVPFIGVFLGIPLLLMGVYKKSGRDKGMLIKIIFVLFFLLILAILVLAAILSQLN